MSNDIGDGSNHLQVVTSTLRVEGADNDQVCIRSDAVITARLVTRQISRLARTRQDASDVATVAILVRHRQRCRILNGIIVSTNSRLADCIPA